MSRYINSDVRRQIARRADFICEYCLIDDDDTFYGCEVEHIISRKHSGSSETDNLAYSCAFCNRFKGTDLTSIDWETGDYVRFFNPRTDIWAEHFKLVEERIEPLTQIGKVTSKILQFNSVERLIERRELIIRKRFPNEAALKKINKL